MHALLFDTETTGTTHPQLIEAAWLELDSPTSLSIIQQFEQRYRPDHKISLGALATHHIYDEELQNCPSHSTFRLPAETQYLIGHNVDYDWQVIGSPEGVKRICTLALARRYLPGLDSHSQSALIYHLDRTNARERLRAAHSALADVQNCLVLLQALIQRINTEHQPTLTTWEELWRYSERARIPEIMPFGKHRGMPIADLPSDYKAWLLRQDGLDPYVKMAVQANF